MNLQEALDYRDKCLICQRELVLKGDNESIVTTSEVGLRVRAGSDYLFKYDGTYERGKFYKKPAIIKKQCPVCVSNVTPAKKIIVKSRSVGMTSMNAAMTKYFGYSGTTSGTTINSTSAKTTLDDLKKQGYSYTFECVVDNAGKYEVKLLSEYIRYCTKEEFWHLNTNFKDNDYKTTLHHARYENNLDNMLTLHLPLVNTNNIKTKEQFIGKFKLYTLFS
jgi:hypothetical protein